MKRITENISKPFDLLPYSAFHLLFLVVAPFYDGNHSSLKPIPSKPPFGTIPGFSSIRADGVRTVITDSSLGLICIEYTFSF